jgi:hypothetical protein
MDKPIITIHNTTTGEIINREMDADEYKEYSNRQKLQNTKKAEAEAKATAKAELLERLGITEDEAKLLLS